MAHKKMGQASFVEAFLRTGISAPDDYGSPASTARRQPSNPDPGTGR